MSQTKISAIQNFQFQGKLSGRMQQHKWKVKFFISLWRSILICLFLRKGFPLENVLSDYLTVTKVMNLFLKAETWVLRSRTE